MARSPDIERKQRFYAVLERHADVVHRYLINRHYSGDELDSEDLLAEVFEIAWRRLDHIPSGAEAPWLVGVARNRLRNMRARQRRRLSRFYLLRPAVASGPAAEDEAIAEMRLREAVGALSEAEREAFQLSVWEGFSPRELGLALGISENAAKLRLSRAKSKILSRMAGDGTTPRGSSREIASDEAP